VLSEPGSGFRTLKPDFLTTEYTQKERWNYTGQSSETTLKKLVVYEGGDREGLGQSSGTPPQRESSSCELRGGNNCGGRCTKEGRGVGKEDSESSRREHKGHNIENDTT